MSLTGRIGTPASQPEAIMPGGPPVVALGGLGTVTLSASSATVYLSATLTVNVALSEASATVYLTSGPGE